MPYIMAPLPQGQGQGQGRGAADDMPLAVNAIAAPTDAEGPGGGGRGQVALPPATIPIQGRQDVWSPNAMPCLSSPRRTEAVKCEGALHPASVPHGHGVWGTEQDKCITAQDMRFLALCRVEGCSESHNSGGWGVYTLSGHFAVTHEGVTLGQRNALVPEPRTRHPHRKRGRGV